MAVKFFCRLASAASLLILTACGGSESNPEPDIDSYTLSGRYQIASRVRVDSDINDPNAQNNIRNNDFSSAQVVPGFAEVHGFVTDDPVNYGWFSLMDDKYDVYQVPLEKDQVVQLQVVDVSQGDLDLSLHDASLQLINSSVSVTEFEEIIVPDDGEYYVTVKAYSGTSGYVLSLDSVAFRNTRAATSTDFRVGEAIVKFKPQSAAVSRLKADPSITGFSHTNTARVALARLNLSNLAIASASTLPSFEQQLREKNPLAYQKYKTLQAIKRLNQNTNIEFAEPNYRYHTMRVPNDEHYASQWNYPAINLPQAWDISTGNTEAASNVIVAVVDTGAFLNHSDFSGQLVDGYDFISDIENAADGDGIDTDPSVPGNETGQINDDSWHGTHVAGTVAAKTNNSRGVAGVAWGAKIMPLRALGIDGMGSTYDVMHAIYYAAGLSNDSNTLPAQKADIINLSLGGLVFSQAAQEVFDEVRAAGVIVVAAAGNGGTNQWSYPASYDGVISVSATDSNNNPALYSNYGSRIDIAAPGGDQSNGILSLLVDDSTGTRVSSVEWLHGTSIATPHASGVFALMRAIHPELSPDDLDSLISAGVITTSPGGQGRDDFVGFGLIDALKAVQEAKKLANGGTLPPQLPLIKATPSQLVMRTDNSARLILSNEGGSDTEVVSFGADVSWLTLNAVNIDANGLGEYQVVIDRTGLSDDVYSTTIRFNLATGLTLEVPISMIAGIVDTYGQSSQVYLRLFDEADTVLAEVDATEEGNGVFSYRFTDVKAGTYSIVGSSNIDGRNNGHPDCQYGEVCGSYPNLEVTNQNRNSLDFQLDILSKL